MSSGETIDRVGSIFEIYPRINPENESESDLKLIEPFKEKVTGLLPELLRSEAYSPLPEVASSKDRCEQFDAMAARRIKRLGQGVAVFAGSGVVSEFGNTLDSPFNYAVVWSAAAVGLAGILKAGPFKTLKMRSTAEEVGSTIFSKKDFFSAMISLKKYEEIRNSR